MTMKRFAAVLSLLTAAPFAFAQNSGIQGVVSDQSGAVIPGVDIRVVNTATGVANTAQSSAAGLYTVPLLNPGTYEIEARAEGFAPATRPNFQLNVCQIARVDFRLSVGTVTEVIEVSAAAAMLESEQAVMG